MKNIGIKAVLNLQCKQEIIDRGLEKEDMISLYNQHDIKTVIYHPVSDSNTQKYAMKTFAATQYLHGMRKKGYKVFIHCSTGVSRAPTVVLAYLTLYKRVNNWNNVDEVNMFLKENHSI